MLSFKDGTQIAIIKGGKLNNQIVKLITDEKVRDPFEKNINKDIEDFIDINKLKKVMGSRKKDVSGALSELIQAFKKVQSPSPHLNDMFLQSKSEHKANMNKELIVHDGRVFHLPNPDFPERLYVSGPSGSGKSTYCSYYLKFLRKMYPDKPFIIFSMIKEDEALDPLNPRRIILDEELVENPIDAEELRNTIILFDDVDAISDKKLSKVVLNLRDQVLTMGRHYGIYCICTNHILTGGRETKVILNEATSFTLFPRSGVNCKYLLERYCGMDKKQIDKIKQLPSRWVTIFKRYPMYVMYSSGIYML